jgi:hypothetical protein
MRSEPRRDGPHAIIATMADIENPAEAGSRRGRLAARF